MKRSSRPSFSIFFFLSCIGFFVFAQNMTPEASVEQASTHAKPAQGTWIRQKAQTSDHGFEVFISSDKDDLERRIWEGVRVVGRHTGELIQFINAIGEGDRFPPADELVDLMDFNFDGEMDFRIPTADGGASPNESSDFFAFDSKTRSFVFDKELSEMTQVSVDSKNKTITSAYRDGCCHHHEDLYAYRAGHRVLVRAWDEALTADGWLETSIGKLAGGKMRYKVKRVRMK